MSALAPILQGFFTDKLIRQRRAGPNTIAAYRDTWRLLLQFASRTTATAAVVSTSHSSTTALITTFLEHLETERANSITHPQRPAGRDPITVPLRGAARTRTCRPHRSGAGDSTQAMRSARRVFPRRRRDRRVAGCAPTG